MPKSLVFDKDSWNVEQVVFVQAIDDESGKLHYQTESRSGNGTDRCVGLCIPVELYVDG